MKKVYAVVLTPTERGYVVYVPDLQINTEGRDLADALEMARDAIGAWGIAEEDAGRRIPEPSTTTPAHSPGDIVTLIDIDFAQYRRANDMTTMRINVSVPKYLKVLGEKAGINFSQVLQDGLKQKLHVDR